MNHYRVEVEYASLLPETFDDTFAANENVLAINREQAVYAAFDQLHDRGCEVIALGAVFIIHEGVPILLLPHMADA